MSGEDVIEILDRLDAAGVRYWVHGGWGKDALLGQETRPHDDLENIGRIADPGVAPSDTHRILSGARTASAFRERFV